MEQVKMIPKVVFGVDSKKNVYIFIKLKKIPDNFYLKDMKVLLYQRVSPESMERMKNVIKFLRLSYPVTQGGDGYFFIRKVCFTALKNFDGFYKKMLAKLGKEFNFQFSEGLAINKTVGLLNVKQRNNPVV